MDSSMDMKLKDKLSKIMNRIIYMAFKGHILAIISFLKFLDSIAAASHQ